MEGKELTIVNIEEYAMTAERVVNQTKLIQEIMKAVMVEDTHYGIIPGTDKPSLYKPGAEKLSVTFRLVPNYEIKQTDLPNGHREYQVVCTLTHAPTGQFFGQGVGSCSTMEAKYRFRDEEAELTDKPVPKNYWNLRKQNKMNEAFALIGGKGFTTKKNADGQWVIAKKTGGKIEHTNPADFYNTVLKMSKKRSHTDAILTATAASDIFTQDLEDTVENGTPPEKEAEKQGPLTAESKPSPGMGNTFKDYLAAMALLKEALGDEVYYGILGEYKHANKILKRTEQQKVYDELVRALQGMKDDEPAQVDAFKTTEE